MLRMQGRVPQHLQKHSKVCCHGKLLLSVRGRGHEAMAAMLLAQMQCRARCADRPLLEILRCRLKQLQMRSRACCPVRRLLSWPSTACHKGSLLLRMQSTFRQAGLEALLSQM